MNTERTGTTMAHTKAALACRRPLRLLAALVSLAALWAGAGSGTALAAEAPVPVWSFSVATAYPTNFAPGHSNGYNFFAINEGEAPTSGEYTFTTTLPAGVGFSLFQAPEVNSPAEDADSHFPLDCETAGQTLTCKGSVPVHPGQRIYAVIPVRVTGSSPATLLSEARVEGGGAAPATVEVPTQLSSELAPFGFLPGADGVSLLAAEGDGSTATQAGSHPSALRVSLHYGLVAGGVEDFAGPHVPDAGFRDIEAILPKGVVVNPTATPKCTEAQLESTSGCPGATQVGTLLVQDILADSAGGFYQPLFNMVSPPGVAAELGAEIAEGTYVHLLGKVLSNGQYRLAANINAIPTPIGVLGAVTTLWGDPSAASHDFARGRCLELNKACSSERSNTPFLTMPGSCGEHTPLIARTDSWAHPGAFSEGSFPGPAIDGCNALDFAPTISSQPTTNLADSPSGLDFNLHQPQAESSEARQGATATCQPGTWTGEPSSYAYQWLRNAAPIPGANAPEYEIQGADAGSLLQCEVAADNGAVGPGRALSEYISVLPSPSTQPPARGKIAFFSEEGGASGGVRFKCKPESWGNSPSFSYRWFANGAEVPAEAESQTQSTYLAAEGDLPVTAQCEVIGANAGGSVAALSSAASSSPGPDPALPEPIGAPSAFVPEEGFPLATAILKDAVVTLPAGMTLNPSAGAGLGACSNEQIGYAPSAGKISFSESPQSCPDTAKLGSLEVSTPLLEEKLPGSVYLAKPYDNPFGSFLAIYLAVEDKKTGIIAKLAGKVEPNPATGQLTATFTENPELPVEDIDLHFFKGPRAALKTPLTCGAKTTTSTLTPWSTPEGADAHPSDSFQTAVAAGGSGPCPSSEAEAPNSPTFTAGTIAPEAGAYSPFVLKLSRPDGSQQLTALDVTLPKGLTAKFAGIPYCSEAQIAQAKSREAPNQGALEQSSPSCPAASEVGTVTVGAGAGITPLYVGGHAYLAGPYKGAPLSLAVVVPIVVGPFDLGAVVVRTALYVNSETAQGRAVSDPLPTILQGIPADVRSIALTVARPDFTLNPTSCDPKAVTGSALALSGQSAALSDRFQVGGCGSLKFKPKLALSLKGATKRAKHPALKAVLTYPKGRAYANTARARVTLPHSEFLEQSHIKTICTRVQFAANNCPKASIYGKAKATTPLLDKPLKGSLYLRSSSHELPDLVVALKGQVDVDLVGRLDTGKGGGIRTTFEAAPDAPVTKFVLEMQGGKKGLLVNSENICKKPQRAAVNFTAHNAKKLEINPLIANSCGKKSRGKKGQK